MTNMSAAPKGSLWITTGVVCVICKEGTGEEWSVDLESGTRFVVLESRGSWVKIIANERTGPRMLEIHQSWWPDLLSPQRLKRIG